MLSICNGYPTHLYVAIMFYSPDTCAEYGNFQTMGWWSIDPGACANVYSNDLEDLNRFWYYYAEADDGETWSGPFTAYVTDQAFNSCVGIGSTDSRIVGFREFDIGDNDDYTLTLTP